MRNRKSLSHRWFQAIIGFMVVIGVVGFLNGSEVWAASPSSISFQLPSSSTDSSKKTNSTGFSLTGTMGEPSSGTTMSSISFKLLPGFRLGEQTPGTLQFSSGTYTVAENARTSTITVTRMGGRSHAVSVSYATSNGTALSGEDYTQVSGSLSWSTGDTTSKTFSIPISNDDRSENDETINLTLSNVTLAKLGSQSTAVLTITNNVNQPPVFANLNATPSFTEGGSATILDADATLSDPELDAIDSGNGNYNGATLTLTRNGGAHSNDVFSNSGNLGSLIEGGDLIYNHTTLGVVTRNSNGSLVLTFNANATSALVDLVLQTITYANSSDAPASSVKIDVTFVDGGSTGQGSGGPQSVTGSVTVAINSVNDAPVNTVAPSIAGDIHVNGTITANKGSWNDNKDGGTSVISYTYQWHISNNADGSNAVNISNATSSSYVPVLADMFKYLSVTVTATDNGGNGKSSSLTTAFTSAIQPDPVALALIAGFATNNDATALTTNDLINVGVTSGTTDNLPAYQYAIANTTGEAANTTIEIQALVNAGDTAVALIKGYAEANDASALVNSQLRAAGVTGTLEGNLVAYQKAVADAQTTASDSTTDIQALIHPIHQTVAQIEAHDSSSPSPITLAQLESLAISGVIPENNDFYNTAFVLATAQETNDVVKIQAIINAVNAAGFDISAISGTTSESGTTATFTVFLLRAPTADVIIPLSSSDTTEGSVHPTQLVFNANNFDQAQTVTVRGIDDLEIDGEQTYTIILGNVISDDLGYRVKNPEDVTVSNIDDDMANFIISEVRGRLKEDANTPITASFAVRLKTQPTAEVSIDLRIVDASEQNDTTEASFSETAALGTRTLTFTQNNWQVDQTIILFSQDDLIGDGDQTVKVLFENLVSEDTNYTTANSSIDLTTLTRILTNQDNDSAGIAVGTVNGKTSEDGKSSASVQITLKTQPSGTVTVTVASTDTGEVTAIPSTLVFTQDNWSAQQNVAFKGIDDSTQDGSQTATITFTGSGTTEYEGMAAFTEVTNTDDDTAALVLGTISGNTREDGTSASFTVRLATQPSTDVILTLSCSDNTEGKIDRTQLTFTTDNWNSDQTINIFGQDDADRDGNQPYTITLNPSASVDNDYKTLATAKVSIENEDDEVVGIILSEMSNAVREDGTTGTFTVRLQLQPSADVTFALSSSDMTEGTVSPSSLTFTPDNWRANQMVTVTGVRGTEGTVDGDQTFVIRSEVTSNDIDYNGMVPANVNVTNIDIDKAGLLVSTVAGSVTEDKTLDKFSISLISAPNGVVAIDVSSSDETEGKVYPAQHLFTSANWNAPHQIVVQGQDDGIVDGPQPFFVRLAVNRTLTTDANYSSLLIDDVRYTNQDNDAASFVLSSISGDLQEGDLIPQEFNVKLSSQPANSSSVTVTLRSSNTAEGTIVPSRLTFTKDDWSSEHKVNVFSVDDNTVDGDQNFYIHFDQAQSNDTNYTITPPSVSAVNRDNDSAHFVVSPLVGEVREDGGSADFKVRLGSLPTGNVAVSIASGDEGEATVSKSKLTFTPSNWDADQTVTVIGVADQIADGDQAFVITLTIDSSTSDTAYAALSIPSISGVNVDTDVAGLVFSKENSNTNEDGDRSSFLLRLRSQPSSPVKVNLMVSDASEASLNTSSVSFNTSDWSAWKTITVIGVDDDIQDDEQTFYVELTVDQNTGSDADYKALPVTQVPFINEDNDVSNIIVTDIDTNTREDGSSASFKVRLSTIPQGEVLVSFAASDSSEVSLSNTSLTFTQENWNADQRVVLRGQDDTMTDGDQQYLIVFNATSSTADANYNGLVPDILTGINEDDDIADFIVDPIATNVNESGTQSFFRLRLRSQPSADVTINFSVTGEDTALPLLSDSGLTFTTTNWKSWQKVTILGQNDSILDGNQPYKVVFVKAASTDPNYKDFLVPALEGITEDNDASGVLVGTPNRNVNEKKRRANFKLRLTSQPTADVTITASVVPELDSSGNIITDTSRWEGKIVSGDENLVFTTTNWNAEQQIRVEGQNDDFQDGDQRFQIQFAVTSSDPNYTGLTLDPVTLINEDDDIAGYIFKLTELSQNVQESGSRGEFEISLRSRPEDENQGGKTVTVHLTSSDTSEGTVEPSTIVFTSEDWSAIHRVRVTGVDDNEVDGDQAFRIDFSAAVSEDPKYHGQSPDSVDIINIDNDVPEFIVSPLRGEANEDGGQATFTVRLKTQPRIGETVTLPLSSNNTAEATVSPSQLIFNANNYSAPQTVTITGIDDGAIQDGGQEVTIVLSAAISTAEGTNTYNGVNPDDVVLINADNDSAGFIISDVSGNVSEEGLEEYIRVRLRTPPNADVTIPISSSDTNEGTVKVSQLVFNATNWDADQLIGVVGVDEANDNDVADGNQVFQVRLGTVISDDSNYNGLEAGEVDVVNLDNDYSDIVVSELSNHVDESGEKGTFYVRLRSNPQADVTLNLTTTNPNEVQFALGTGTTTTMTLPYNINNWRGRQPVTLVGMDDSVADGDQLATIQIEVIDQISATSYQKVIGQEVDVRNEDNDVAGFIVSPIKGNTEEDGSVATFTVRLESAPTDDVVLGMSSSNALEGTVYPVNLIFTPNNWDAEQIVRVTGVDDAIHDGNQAYTIDFASSESSDANYLGLTPTSVIVTNEDDESPGYLVTSPKNATREDGTQTDFCIRLSSKPTQNVTVPLRSSDETEGKVYPSSLTFTELNWNACQIITVIGQDDALAQDGSVGFFARLVNKLFGLETERAASAVVQDGDQAYQVVFGAGASADPSYSGITPDRVRLINEDDDTAGYIFSTIEGTVNENGSQGVFTVQLRTIPSGQVTVDLSVSDSTEGFVSPTQLVFTSENYNAARTVTVTGLDDLITDGNRSFNVEFAVTATENSNNEYAALETKTVSVTNEDNEMAGLVVSPISGQPREDGQSGSFTVSLQTQPSAEVQVSVASSDNTEILFSSGATTTTGRLLTFDTNNWDTAQTLTLVGQDDAIADGNQTVRITFSTVASADTSYAALNPPFLETTNEDNDTVGFLLTDPVGTLNESGGSATFSLRLNTQPTADVTVPLVVDKTDEISLSSTSLTFTAGDYATPQVVTITSLDESVADGNQLVAVLLGATQSTDVNYNDHLVGTLTVVNYDNDSPGFTVSAVTGKAAESGGESATFDIKLSIQPASEVTLNLSNSNTSEGSLATTSLSFGPGNWDQAQSVTVDGVDDGFQDGNQTFVISAIVTSGDANYNGLAFDPVTVQSKDDDQVDFVISTNSITVNENASTDSFSINLQIQPTTDVMLNFSTDTTEAALSHTSLTFTMANWYIPQEVVITGVNDDIVDGSISSLLQITIATDDTAYANLAPPMITIHTADNDSNDFLISDASDLTVTEANTSSDTFSVKLTTKPLANVTIRFSSSNVNEATVIERLVFTPTNWNMNQTVTIMAVDDVVDDGDQTISITATIDSTDTSYSTLRFPSVSVLTVDDDKQENATNAGVSANSDTYTSSLIDLSINWDDQVNVGEQSGSDDEIVREYVPANGSASGISKTTTVMHKKTVGDKKAGLEGIVEPRFVDNQKSTVYLEGNAKGFVSDAAAFVGTKTTDDVTVKASINFDGGIEVAVTPKDSGQAVLLPEMALGTNVVISETRVVAEISLPDNVAGSPRVVGAIDPTRWYFMGRDLENSEVVYLRGKSGAKIKITRMLNGATTLIQITEGSVEVRIGFANPVEKVVGEDFRVNNHAHKFPIHAGSNLISAGVNSPLSSAEFEVKMRDVHSVWRWNYVGPAWQVYSPQVTVNKKLTEELGLSGLTTDVQSTEGMWIYSEVATTYLMHDKEYVALNPDLSLEGWYLLGNNSGQAIRVGDFFSQNSSITSLWLVRDDRWKNYASDPNIDRLVNEHPDVDQLSENDLIAPGQAFWINTGANYSTQRVKKRLNVPPGGLSSEGASSGADE